MKKIVVIFLLALLSLTNFFCKKNVANDLYGTYQLKQKIGLVAFPTKKYSITFYITGLYVIKSERDIENSGTFFVFKKNDKSIIHFKSSTPSTLFSLDYSYFFHINNGTLTVNEVNNSTEYTFFIFEKKN